jgi:peptidoglycan/LPS O-acetylase OafA/YrhL
MISPKNPTGRGPAYIPSLDGWRAIAIFWVMQGHSQIWTIGHISNRWLVYTGYRGVQLFFALSGFLICTRLLREETRFGSISLRSFYTRRVFRIQPAAMAYLIVVTTWMLWGRIPSNWQSVAGAALMIRNIWPLKLSPGYGYTIHFWSLAVEEHFYLLLPGFLVLVRRNRLAILSLVVVMLEIWRMIVLMSDKLQHGLFWQVEQRTDVVLAGILLGSVFSVALTHQKISSLATTWLKPWVALLYTAFVFIELQRHHSSLIQATVITVYPFLIVATALHPSSWSTRFLELTPLRFVGRISYSLYLWHPLFIPHNASAVLHPFRSQIFFWSATFACATASYYLIETPLIRYGHKIAKRFDLQKQPTPIQHSLNTLQNS